MARIDGSGRAGVTVNGLGAVGVEFHPRSATYGKMCCDLRPRVNPVMTRSCCRGADGNWGEGSRTPCGLALYLLCVFVVVVEAMATGG